jgi:hypothetical protein
MGIGVHHDAIKTGVSLAARCKGAWEISSTRPIGALWLHTDGSWMVGAAGATNTQGQGGPYRTSKGTIPLDQGNRFMLSIEASNNGVGEVWPEVMQDSYVRGCAALCKWLGLNPLTDVIAHFEWTTRKIDPAGPSRYAAGATKWNMPAFRSDVQASLAPTPPPPLTDYQRIAMSTDFEFASAPRWDTRGFGQPLPAGEYDVQLAGSAGKIGARVNMTIVSPTAAGYGSAWAQGPRPDTSKINYAAGQTIANEISVPLAADGRFRVFISSPAHILFDLVGYYL